MKRLLFILLIFLSSFAMAKNVYCPEANKLFVELSLYQYPDHAIVFAQDLKISTTYSAPGAPSSFVNTLCHAWGDRHFCKTNPMSYKGEAIGLNNIITLNPKGPDIRYMAEEDQGMLLSYLRQFMLKSC